MHEFEPHGYEYAVVGTYSLQELSTNMSNLGRKGFRMTMFRVCPASRHEEYYIAVMERPAKLEEKTDG